MRNGENKVIQEKNQTQNQNQSAESDILWPLRYAMKTLEKAEMLERNKVMRVLTEAKILSVVDHPFLASLYGTIVTDTHLHFLMQICEGGELYALLTSQPSKRFKESHVRFYTAEVCVFPVVLQ
jgi:serine/threonine protein kinase